MPNFDGTGPQGKGPETGRGMGKCGQNKDDDSSNTPVLGLGRGCGAGRGQGGGQGAARRIGRNA